MRKMDTGCYQMAVAVATEYNGNNIPRSVVICKCVCEYNGNALLLAIFFCQFFIYSQIKLFM